MAETHTNQTASGTTTPKQNTTNNQTAPITQLLDKVIQAFVAIVDGFVQVLSDNATAIAELSVAGALLAGATRVFGEAIGGLKGIMGF